jgi:hypothetical protein
MAGFNLKPKQFKSWSNSRWNDYARCPAYAHYKHIMKLPEPKSEAMARGAEIAEIEEGFFAGKVRLPALKKVVHPNVITDLQAAKKQPTMFFEQNWGFDATWNEVDYFDWTNCKLRVKVDFGWQSPDGVVHLRDNKTGKYNSYDVEKYLQQLDLYRAAAVSRFPNATGFTSQLIYTDLGIRYPQEPLPSTVKEAKAAQKVWDKRVKPMFADTRFDPKPNNGCRWCAFSKAKGGPCKF